MRAELEKTLAGLEADLRQASRLSTDQVTYLDQELTGALGVLHGELRGDIASMTLAVSWGRAVVYLDFKLRLISVYLPASPSLSGIIAAIAAAIKIITKIVETLVNIIQLLHLDDIHRILMLLWPEYRAQIAKIKAKISKASEIVGWGTDGLAHLLHATLGGINTLGALMGKPDDWIQGKRAEQTIRILGGISASAKEITINPSIVLSWVFDRYTDELNEEGRTFWTNTSALIEKGTEIAESALTGLGDAVTELQEIKNGMPEAVRKNIPIEIWNALEKAEKIIFVELLPSLYKVNKTIESINAQLVKDRNKLSGLANSLLHPGDILLGVDNLPDYARAAQEALIDEVTSRRFLEAAEGERGALSADLDEFDRIDELMSVETPPPSFLTLETPARAAALGIVTEPAETWFINGLKDTL